jgi:hypothetical protein
MKLPMKSVIAATLLATAIFTSCTNEDPIPTQTVQSPGTYTFERNNATSISFSGQTTRIAMAEETFSAMLDPTQTLDGLNDRFAHVQGNPSFTNSSLNSSDKNLRSKVAASADFYAGNTTVSATIRADFDSYLSRQVTEVFPVWNRVATPGNAGNLQQAGGGPIRYVNAKGLQYNQAWAKALIGGLMVDQIANNYVSAAVLDAGTNRADNDSDLLVSGKNYTTMEHYWDEAFGYLYGAEPDITNPVLTVDNFLGQYLGRVERDTDFTGIATTIYDAFKLGRAAIVAKDYALRDQQAQIIQKQLSEIIGIRAVFYLENCKPHLGVDNARAFHALAEGYGFIYSLQFTRKPGTMEPYFTRAEVQVMLDQLMANNGFWDLTIPTIDSMSALIANRFDFTISQASN